MSSYENTPSTPPREITHKYLLQVSRNLWDSEVYGKTAGLILGDERRNAYVAVSSDDYNNPRSHRGTASEEKITSKALDAWDAMRTPFEPECRHYPEGQGTSAFTAVTASSVSRLHLADFGRSRNYDQHGFHGAVGETFDVLAVASGIVKAHEIGASRVNTEFISVKELRDRLQGEFSLSPHYWGRISAELKSALALAIQEGKTPSYGEVIFEGRLSRLRHPEEVALGSLKAMAGNFPKDGPVASALKKLTGTAHLRLLPRAT